MPIENELNDLATLPYRPQSPRDYRPGIGLIGCGGISGDHLQAYQNAGWNVIALCDLNREAAESRRAQFFPDAQIYQHYEAMLESEKIEVVDIATHPPGRPKIVAESLNAGKHVLSQKPFVLDLDEGQELVELAKRQGRYLAVNQNGRWAPHFSYARLVAAGGHIGDVFGAHLSCHWDHTWTAGTEFENIRHLILYDYAIHWFDILRSFFRTEPTRVFASTARAPEQSMKPALLAQAAIEFPQGQATLAFDAAVTVGPHDRTFLSGTTGTFHSHGPDIQEQQAFVTTAAGTWQPQLEGRWFPDGFQGAMGELLCAIEDGRKSLIDAEDNLNSLALCFAAIASAESGTPMRPGEVRKITEYI